MYLGCFWRTDGPTSTSPGEKEHRKHLSFFWKENKKRGAQRAPRQKTAIRSKNSSGHGKAHAHLTARGTTQPTAKAQHTHGHTPFVLIIPINTLCIIGSLFRIVKREDEKLLGLCYNEYRMVKTIDYSIVFTAKRQVWRQMIESIICAMLVAMTIWQNSNAVLLRRKAARPKAFWLFTII